MYMYIVYEDQNSVSVIEDAAFGGSLVSLVYFI